jgi:hypothetical protein
MIKKSKEHLNAANENYFKHMIVALKISYELFLASFMAFIHALLPALFTTKASSKIKNLYIMIENRKK